MPAGHEFLYFLMSDNTHFYSMQNGALNVSTTPRPLQFSPDGWHEISIQNQRNSKYFGIDRTITIPYSFVEDGAGILKSVFYKYGIEAKCNLVICQQQLDISSTEYGFWYKVLLKAEVDLSTFNHAGFKVTCTMVESGLPKYLKANENTTYEFPLDVPETVPVVMDGINLNEKLNFEVENQSFGANGYNFIGITFLNNEGNAVGVTSYSVGQRFSGNSSPDYVNYLDYFLATTIDVSVHFVFKLRILALPGVFSQHSRVYLHTQSREHELIARGSLNDSTATQEFSFDFTWALLAGEHVFLVIDSTTSGFLPINFEVTDFTASFKTRKAPDTIKTLRPLYLFQQLINKVSDGILQAESNLLTLNNNVVFTSGDGIRNLANPKVKISLSDFFGFWDTFKDVGMTMRNGKVILERKEDLIDYTTVTDLGEVSNPVVTVASEHLFNTLKIGYPDKQQEGVNGKEMFNNTFEFSLGTMRVAKELNKVCKIISDPYSAEITRVTFDAKDTTDSRQDNDVYVLDVKNSLITTESITYEITMSGPDTIVLVPTAFGNGLKIGDTFTIDGAGHYTVKNLVQGSGLWNVYIKENPTTVSSTTGLFLVYRNILNRDMNATVTGLIEPETVFNLIFTPKRCLLNNGGYFHSVFDLNNSKTFKFQTASKNDKVATATPDVIEKADVNVGSLAPGYFKPYYIDFDTEGDIDLLDELDANPLRLFSFTFMGKTYKGIPEKVGIEPSSRKSQTYKLLCSKDTDLKPLIDYYG